jgi:hypothetical protein
MAWASAPAPFQPQALLLLRRAPLWGSPGRRMSQLRSACVAMRAQLLLSLAAILSFSLAIFCAIVSRPSANARSSLIFSVVP